MTSGICLSQSPPLRSTFTPPAIYPMFPICAEWWTNYIFHFVYIVIGTLYILSQQYGLNDPLPQTNHTHSDIARGAHYAIPTAPPQKKSRK